MGNRSLSNIVAFDDAPFDRAHRGDVPVVGTVYAGPRLDGVLIGRVRRDGANAAHRLASLIGRSKYREHTQLVMLQGVTLAGFNVVDAHWLHAQLSTPVLIVARHRPDLEAVRKALLTHVRGGAAKWALIEKLGPMEPCGAIYVQRVGLDREETVRVVERCTLYGNVPEPLRTAHLIAGALTRGESRARA